MRTIILNYRDAHPVNREKFMEMYSSNKTMKMVQNTPLIVNVLGTYIKVNDILGLLVNKADFKFVSAWLEELKNPTPMLKSKQFEFIWRK